MAYNRVPKIDDVLNEIKGDTPQAARAEKRLRQAVGRAYNKLTQVQKAAISIPVPSGAPKVLPIETILAIPNPYVKLDTHQLAYLKGLVSSIQGVRGNALEVEYAGLLENTPPADATDEAGKLKQLVANACATMKRISDGNDEADIAAVLRVFEASGQNQARTIFGKAALALRRLYDERKIVIDQTGSVAAVNSGASASPQGMRLLMKNLDPDPKNTVVVIHESTHAIADTDGTGDHVYTDAPGFLTATVDTKLKNAAHYEEVARQLLISGAEQRTFSKMAIEPVASVTAELAVARKDVNELLTHAWIVAIRLHEQLVKWFKDEADEDNGLTKKAFSDVHKKQFGTYLRNISYVLGLSLHQDKTSLFPKIGKIDLAVAENRAAALAEYVNKSKDFNVIDDRNKLAATFFGWSGFVDERSTAAYLYDTLLQQMVKQFGRIRKTDEKTIFMIKDLASMYDPEDMRKKLWSRPLETSARLYGHSG